MDIKYKLFPYPVLGEMYDDYKESKVMDEIRYEKIGKEIVFNLRCHTNNIELRYLIEQGKASYTFHIECPQTSFRNIVKTDKEVSDFKVNEEKICGKVQVCVFIVANTDINNYWSSDFDDDYEGTSFNIEKGNILAISNQYNLQIDKEKDDLGKVPSIFSIFKKIGKNEGAMSFELGGEKIKILLSEKDYDNYRKVAGTVKLQPVIHSMIIIPALVYVFEVLKREEFENYEDSRWFRAIKKTLKNNNIELSKETLDTNSSIELAQTILGMPLSRAFENILNENHDEEDE